MTEIFVHGCGVVSPAGWGMAPFCEALARGKPIPPKPLARPGWVAPLTVRAVPPPTTKPAFLNHNRLRRASPISQYAVAAAFEALGPSPPPAELGIVMGVLAGCVNYSRRFYDETLRNPAEASPLIFPETVFNAPASHLSALLGASGSNYTVVGDSAVFPLALAIGAQWLLQGRVQACLAVAAEEIDWLTGDAFRLFYRGVVISAGAGALYLKRDPPAKGPAVRLEMISDPFLYLPGQDRLQATRQLRAAFPDYCPTHLLCDGLQGDAPYDRAEQSAWRDWPGRRISPKKILGEGLAASGAWQSAAAVRALLESDELTGSHVSVVGCHQQAIGAHFSKSL